jgi:hypothetical protein
VFDVRLRDKPDDRTVVSRSTHDPAVTDKIHGEGVRAAREADRADRAADRAAAHRAADRAETGSETGPVERAAPPVPAGPRPRASLLATLSLIAGVAAALLVLSGALAGYGVALGVLTLILAVAGISATRRRHVAGKADAIIGLVLGLGAVVVGVLALTGSLSWLTLDTTPVTNARRWLDATFIHGF